MPQVSGRDRVPGTLRSRPPSNAVGGHGLKGQIPKHAIMTNANVTTARREIECGFIADREEVGMHSSKRIMLSTAGLLAAIALAETAAAPNAAHHGLTSRDGI